DRIMFPIHDGSGRVLGFGGRVLDKGEPKYLNSPETPLFSKGRELYGLFQARQAIRAAGKVVVVEGYMDVVAVAQHGIEYALSTRHAPSSAEGRAALVHAAKPLLAQLTAPVLTMLLRRRIAQIVGLSEGDLSALLPAAQTTAASRQVRPTTQRAAPSLLRGLIKCVLLNPALARKFPLPKPSARGGDGATLAALVEFCEETQAPLTTAGLLQHFTGSTHEPVLIAALTAAEDEGLDGDLLEIQLVEGVKHYWMHTQRRGGSGELLCVPQIELTPEEAERARQLKL